MHSSHQTWEGVRREKPWASSPGGLSHPEKTLLNCLRLVALAQEVLFPEVMVWPPRLLLEKWILPLKEQLESTKHGDYRKQDTTYHSATVTSKASPN